MRVLKLDDAAMRRLHIGDVLLPILGPMNDLLPFGGKFVFPSAMPFGLVLPPWIALADSVMGPMPHSAFPTFRHHLGAASRAFATKTRFGFTAESFNKCKFHDDTPSFPADAPSLAVSRTCCESADGGRLKNRLDLLCTS
jgi:hypothetical protein